MAETSNQVSEIEPLLKSNTPDKKQERFSDLKGHGKALAASFFISIVAGLNDGSLGTIIPRLKAYYDITNETISMLFLCSAIGFFISAGLNGYIVHKIGQLKTLYLGSTTMLVAFIILSLGLPFPIMVCTMPFVGGGMALLDAAMNVYTANLPLATLMLNILHGNNAINNQGVTKLICIALYGVGAMISPLVAATFLKYDFSWTFMYVFLSFVAFLNIIGITVGFWNVNFDEIKEDSEDQVVMDHSALTKKAIFNRVTMIAAAYILIYVGVEVTLGGWGYTFLKEGRHGDEIIMARVVSGYWAGLASGRIILGYVSSRFGEKLMIALFTVMIVVNLIIMMVSTDITLDSIGKNLHLFVFDWCN